MKLAAAFMYLRAKASTIMKNYIMSPQTPPLILYKYVTFEVLKKILEKPSIKFKPPNEFNDPFEFLPSEYDTSEQSIRSWLEKEGRNSEGWQQYKEYFDKKNMPEIQKALACKIGVFCMSEKKDNLLMWAHYADGHNGAVIAFDTSKIFEKPSPNWLKVEYMDKRIKLPFRDYIKEESSQLADQLASRKSCHWEYECEWRVLGVRKNENDDGIVAISKDAIKTIIIGVGNKTIVPAGKSDCCVEQGALLEKTEQQIKIEEIQKINKEKYEGKIQIQKAVCSKDSFSLDFENV